MTVNSQKHLPQSGQNNHNSKSLQERLQQEGVPCEIVGRVELDGDGHTIHHDVTAGKVQPFDRRSHPKGFALSA